MDEREAGSEAKVYTLYTRWSMIDDSYGSVNSRDFLFIPEGMWGGGGNRGGRGREEGGK